MAWLTAKDTCTIGRSSRADVVSSTDAACSPVPCESVCAVEDTCAEAPASAEAPSRTHSTAWPAERRFFETISPLAEQHGAATLLHICGNTLSRIQYIRESGFDAFHFDSKVDAAKAVEAAAGGISLVGGVSNIEALYNGTPELVSQQVRYAIEAGVRVIGPECAVPLRTPLENLMAIARVRDAALAGETTGDQTGGG